MSCVRQTLRNRPQPAAPVYNRPRQDHMAMPMLSSAKGIAFRAFQHRMAPCRVAGVALRDIPTCVMTCQKLVVCVASAMLLPRFQKMRCIFRSRRSNLKTSDVILHGRRSTFDMSCCVIFANPIVSAARSGDKVQIPWHGWHFLTSNENRWKPRTKRRF